MRFLPPALLSLALALPLALAPRAAPPAGEALLPAPYQVEGVVRYRNDVDAGDDGLGLAPALVAVDLGAVEGTPQPRAEDFRDMTLLGTAGAAAATLQDIVKSCEFLCGDEAEECHYLALLAPQGPPSAGLETLGTPLAALPGHHEIAAFAPLAAEPLPQPPAAPAFSEAFAAPVWSPYPEAQPAYRVTRWDPAAGALALELRYGADAPSRFETNDCTARGTGELTAVSCNALAFLAAGGRPLLVSFPDYNLAAAAPVARFEAAGPGANIRYTLVRLGLKAQTVFGLLAATPAGWRARFRPRDYALLC
jgi:hypothetical protein